jgi:signal transduction histidine kinase/CheY-like chemotaxis protein
MPVEQSFAYGTVAAYALLAVLWGAILVLYLRYRRVARAEDPLIALLLAVLALDAFKSLIESVYFGIVWTANYGIGFEALREPLSHPVPLTLTKVLNVFVAATVLTVLVRRWLPAELAQRRAQREERERMLRQHLEAQKLESLGLLAGGIAHDFNNLLWTVSANAELAAEALPEDSPAQPRLTAVKAAAQRGAALTRQLLVYAGKQETAAVPLDLGQLVTDIGDLLRVSIPRSIDLAVVVEPDLPEVRGEAAQLQQVVLNLLTNAADAIGAGSGSIAVSVTGRRLDRDQLTGFQGDDLAAGEYVVLEVADTGCGMDEATRERIFDPFFSTKGSGRGLGLAALAGILRAHAAGIAIDTAPGRGTRFQIALPALVRRARTGHTPPLRVLPRGAGVALVVGEDEAARQRLAELLGDVGFEVVDAASVAEALEAAESVGAALALSVIDWDLPDGTGLKLARLLHQGAPTLPQMLMTDTDLAERRTAAAPALLLPKPIRSDDLYAALVRLGFTT